MLLGTRTAKKTFKTHEYTATEIVLKVTRQQSNVPKSTKKFSFDPELVAWRSTSSEALRLLSEKKIPVADQAKDLLEVLELKDLEIFIIDDIIYAVGDTWTHKKKLSDIGLRWGGYKPEPHYYASYEPLIARRLNETFGSNLPVEGDVKPKLVIYGSRVHVKNVGNDVYSAIADSMKFQPKGIEYSDKVRSGEWDGFISLFDWKKKSVPIGFFDRTLDVLNELNITPEIEDRRIFSESIELDWNGKTLRPYQNEAVDEMVRRESGFLSSPTGTGKTVMGMKILHELQRPALILVHKTELLYQWQDRLESTFGIEVGLIGDGHYTEKDITVAMVQTATKYSKLPKNRYGVLMVDEGHHTPADTFYDLADRIEARYRFALSATPRREDGLQLKLWAQTGEVFQAISAREAIDKGYLVEPKFETVDGWDGSTTNSGNHVSRYSWQEDVSYACASDEVNKRLVDRIEELFNDGHIIYVDVRRIAHGNELERLISARGMEVDFIYGRHSSETREEVLSDFAKGGRVLVSTLIKEGVDLPEMTAIVLAGPAQSLTENLQKVGRALRPKPDGTNEAIVVDRRDFGRYSGRWFETRQKQFKSYYS